MAKTQWSFGHSEYNWVKVRAGQMNNTINIIPVQMNDKDMFLTICFIDYMKYILGLSEQQKI